MIFTSLEGVPFDIGAVVAEEGWHEDLLWMVLVAVGEDVGPLDDLWEEAENVIEDKDGCVRVRRTRYI